jgi:hypothetical protein
MSSQNYEFDVLRVVELARYKKYEITSAGFAALDKIDNIDSLPKKLKNRKPAVQALYAISEKLVNFDYFTPEQRKKLLQEAAMSDAPYKNKNIFSSSNAPVVEEDLEEEFIPQDEPKQNSFDDDSESFGESITDESEDYSDDFDEEETEADDFEEEEAE